MQGLGVQDMATATTTQDSCEFLTTRTPVFLSGSFWTSMEGSSTVGCRILSRGLGFDGVWKMVNIVFFGDLDSEGSFLREFRTVTGSLGLLGELFWSSRDAG